MTPSVTTILVIDIMFGVLGLGFVWWRFGSSDALVFAIVAGSFTARVVGCCLPYAMRNSGEKGVTLRWVSWLVPI